MKTFAVVTETRVFEFFCRFTAAAFALKVGGRLTEAL